MSDDPVDHTVTDEYPPGPSKSVAKKPSGEHVIKVQPLKRSEMQVRASDTRLNLALILGASW